MRCAESLNIGPRSGSGQSSPAASNHGFHMLVSGAQQRVSGESAGRCGSRPFANSRAAHRKEPVFEQELDTETRPFAEPVADRHIGIVVREVDVRAVGADIGDRRSRTRRDEATDRVQQPQRGERRDDAHSKLSRVRRAR
jgi:hypothetical protein